MSHYLIKQLDAIDNVVRAHPHRGRRGLRRRPPGAADAARPSHGEQARPSTPASMFVFIGAAPRTDWLDGVVERDERGFVPHRPGPGGRRAAARPAGRSTATPTTWSPACPGVFVAGDVRADSVKRVASAVGEGAMAVTLVHRYLAEQ